MAYSSIAFVAPNYRDYDTWWLKAYKPDTTTPIPMSIDEDGFTLVSKLQIDKDGFIVSAGGAKVIPRVDGYYDLWLFPTEAEADDNDTSEAIRMADNVAPPINSDIIDQIEDEADALFDEIVASFQARFSMSQPPLPWEPNILIEDELQLYTTGVVGESGYAVWLADPAQLPFTTSATFAEDEALGRWQDDTNATKSWVKSNTVPTIATTTLLIGASLSSEVDRVYTKGFYSSGDGGGAQWQLTGVTGQTPSQSPSQLGYALLNDANGNQWRLVYSHQINAKSIGATGDGVSDDSGVLIAAFASAGGSTILFPNGEYFMDTTASFTASTAQESLILRGESVGSTVFRFSIGSNIVIQQKAAPNDTGNKSAVEISGIKFITEGADADTALVITNDINAGSTSIRVTLRDISFSGADDLSGWNTGIYINSSTFGTYDSIVFTGYDNKGTLFKFDATGGSAVDNTLSNIKCVNLYQLMDIKGSYEGFYLDKIVGVNTINGIKWESSLSGGEEAQPLFNIANSHINSKEVGIKLIDIRQVSINSTLFYSLEEGSVSVDISRPSQTAVQLGMYQISSCNFQGTTTGEGSNAINLSNNVSGVNISANGFYVMGTAIKYDSTVSVVQVSQANTFNNITDEKRLFGPYTPTVNIDETYRLSGGVMVGHRVGGCSAWNRRVAITSTDATEFTVTIPVNANAWSNGGDKVFMEKVDFVTVKQEGGTADPSTAVVFWDSSANSTDTDNIHITLRNVPVGQTVNASIVSLGR